MDDKSHTTTNVKWTLSAWFANFTFEFVKEPEFVLCWMAALLEKLAFLQSLELINHVDTPKKFRISDITCQLRIWVISNCPYRGRRRRRISSSVCIQSNQLK